MYYYTSSPSSNTTLSLIISHVFSFFHLTNLAVLTRPPVNERNLISSVFIHREPLITACVCVLYADCSLNPLKHTCTQTNTRAFTVSPSCWPCDRWLTASKWRMSSKNEREWRVKKNSLLIEIWTEGLIREEQHCLRFEEKPSEEWRS